MKAIIPVAGAGTKLRPLTYTQPKPLIPVAGKPILSFIVDQLIDAGVDDFIFVIGYLGDKIKEFLEEKYPKVSKQYVIQKERIGLGQAIYECKELCSGTKDLVIQLGDTILDLDLRVFLNSKRSCLAVRKVLDPRQFGVVELEDNGYVKKLVEKPQIPKTNLAIVGLYYISDIQKLLQALEYNIEHNITTKGAFHLTDGLMRLVEQGEQIDTMEVKNWFDCGKKEILLETNAILLDRSQDQSIRQEIPGSIIVPPVSIGEDCIIQNSIIGPNVTIGNNTQILNAIVKDSIVGNYTTIEDLVVNHSIIGNDALIRGKYQSFNIGDNTEIDLQ
ncbi:MAG TPA: sugar phosphate nucleotidyltransferase [Saprospiraceae bacterium]|nr:sugar phosphate nucleotidyltransferase [Saprospiraceae bacterium]